MSDSQQRTMNAWHPLKALSNAGAAFRPARLSAIAAGLLAGAVLAGCAKIDIPAHLKPLSNDMMRLMAAKKMRASSPIFIRIFKAEAELEVWKQRKDGRFYHLKTYPICAWSGRLGPKFKQGDKQAPEGFYTVNRYQMNPNSSFHLSFDLGYPNAFDRANRRTGNFLMVHGDCTSAGCYAMTDTWIEEIYALAREAFIGGQNKMHVHAFPFRFTEANLQRHSKSRHRKFWATLRQGYDAFEANRVPPPVVVCERRYVVNAVYSGPKPDPTGACPRLERPVLEPFVPLPSTANGSERYVRAPGPKRQYSHTAQNYTARPRQSLGRIPPRSSNTGRPAMSDILFRGDR
ncbi:MAG: murein L,D-transpeptidase family protein [Pseudomonadota bacterium]